MKIFIIRHGETTGDIENLYGGNYDDHLTEKGIAQAKELAEKLKSRGVQSIFSSPLIRAKETADILKDTLKCEVEIIDDFRERNNYGILTGMNKDEVKLKHPDLVEKLKDYHNAIEGAEVYDDFIERIRKAFEEATKSSHQTIAVVTHGQAIRCLFRSVLRIGELGDKMGDCAFLELEKNGSEVSIVAMDGVNRV